MAQQYNQFRAMMAITKASLRAIFRNPSAVAFSFGFPLVFILVFGFIGGGAPTVSVGLINRSDTSNEVISNLLHYTLVRVADEKDSVEMMQDLEKGRIAAVLSVDSSVMANGRKQYIINSRTSSASGDKYPIFKSQLSQVVQYKEEMSIEPANRPILLHELPVMAGRKYSMIDFILPGMLGFSLLSAAVFGVAFLFFNLRQQLVLKRWFATPIGKPYIVMGEALARVVFQLITAFVIVGMGEAGLSFYPCPWLGHFCGNDVPEPVRADRFYGVRIYHQQRG